MSTRNVVIDAGSLNTRVGFAGETLPQKVFPTVVAHSTRLGVACGGNQSEAIIGQEVEQQHTLKKGMSCVRPVSDGFVQEWEDMQSVWRYAVESDHGLKAEFPDCNVMITEEANNPKHSREKAAEIFLEELGAGGFAVESESVLSLISTGADSGVVVEIGHGQCDICPIYERTVLAHAWHKLPIGGEELTGYLASLLRVESKDPKQSKVVQQLKEKYCFVAQDFDEELENLKNESFEVITCELPDGRRVTLGNEQFRVPEVLFQPELLGLRETAGVVETTYSAIMNCDVDLHETFLQNVVLSGGTASCPGLKPRFAAALEKFMRAPVRILDCHSEHAAWIGGSMLASAESMEWVTPEEWDEHGAEIVHRRFPRSDRPLHDENPVTPSRRRALSKQLSHLSESS
eukprot:TRINITY_DN32174_c0_g1_i1.p1 TRINITY_DN32174_c0_g1~~TRINITY_DN32174_c0_g1_i1.p1  ORF type:complete len:403 (+),score=93.50 TRINITY_DN32174_c0_g1_i1:73-1281(+)